MKYSIKKQINRAGLVMLALGFISVKPGFAQKNSKPNIILVMVDDLGFSDIGPYGANEIETPTLDRLASEGLRLKEFYNNSICAPTRASLLTGQYSHKAGIGYFNVNLGLPGYQGFLNKESLTIAEVLKQAGYSTLMSGKWHVGDDKDQWPNQRGFDKFFGFIGGASNYYEIGDKGRETVQLVKNNEPYALEKGKYLTDEITSNALGFIDEQNKENKPFFLYLAFNAPHWPLQATDADIAKYKGRYNIGWDSLRVVRHQNAIKKGVIDANQKIALADKQVKSWNKLTYDEQQYWQRRQEVFAAMIDHVDQSLAKLLAKLKELKKDDNTLIVFISDNGAQGGNGTRPYSQRITGPVGSAGSYETQNSNWSQTGNSPLRSYKDSPYEGGISAPFIAWYPKRIQGNTLARGTAHLIDLAPTFYDLAGAKYPEKFNGVVTNQPAGKSLVPLLTGKTQVVERGAPLFWERAGKSAVRDGNWKLVLTPQSEGGKWELYNLDNDRAENKNVASEHPEIVERLQAEYKKWAERNGVVEYSKLRPVQQTTPASAAGAVGGSSRTQGGNGQGGGRQGSGARRAIGNFGGE